MSLRVITKSPTDLILAGKNVVSINGEIFMLDTPLVKTIFYSGGKHFEQMENNTANEVSNLDFIYDAVNAQLEKNYSVDAPNEYSVFDAVLKVWEIDANKYLAFKKRIKTSEIVGKHEEIVQAMIGQVPNEELASWPKQEEQARAWNADNTVVTPLIDGLLTGRAIAGETKQILVDKIIQNADAYEAAYAPVLGNYQSKMKLITAATTSTQVDAIVW